MKERVKEVYKKHLLLAAVVGVLVFGIILATQGGDYIKNNDTEVNQSPVNVTVSNETCVETENKTECYNQTDYNTTEPVNQTNSTNSTYN